MRQRSTRTASRQTVVASNHSTASDGLTLPDLLELDVLLKLSRLAATCADHPHIPKLFGLQFEHFSLSNRCFFLPDSLVESGTTPFTLIASRRSHVFFFYFPLPSLLPRLEHISSIPVVDPDPAAPLAYSYHFISMHFSNL